jgi:hypothetical protein
VLRGWGNYFRTGNADREFNKMDAFVIQSLRRLAVSARRATPGETSIVHLGSASCDGPVSIAGHGAIPVASHTPKIIVKVCAGKRHARF